MIANKMFTFFAFCFVAGTFLSGIMEGQAAFAVTKLTADISASDTTVTVTSTQDFLDVDDVYIESEKIRYTGTTATQFTGATRGFDGTDAVAHLTGAKVKNESSNVVNNLLGYNVAAASSAFGNATAIVGLGWNLMNAVPKMIAWDYSYLQGQLALIKYLILWPISVGFVFSLGLVFISAIQGIFRL